MNTMKWTPVKIALLVAVLILIVLVFSQLLVTSATFQDLTPPQPTS